MKTTVNTFKLPYGEIKARVYDSSNRLVKLVMIIDNRFTCVNIPKVKEA